MKIYKFFHKSADYKAINIKGSNLELQLSNHSKEVDFGSFEGTKYKWTLDEGKKSDAPFIDGCIPVISDKAYICLSELIKGNVKAAKIRVDGEPYNILYGEKVINGVLNLEKSQIRYFRDGRIMQIKKYVFNSAEFPPVFKIAEDPTFVFVTEDVISAINAAGLTGFNWDECELV